MDLSRAAEKFATTEILYLDPVSDQWYSTGLFGSLQVYDRFITDRAFGQKKRILTLPAGSYLPEEYGNFMLEGGSVKYILESLNEDIRYNQAYAQTYMLHAASAEAQILEDVTTTLASGAKSITGQNVVETHWIDVERYRGEGSKTFDDVDYTVASLMLPKIATINTANKIKFVETGVEYTISEIFDSLDLLIVRGTKVGV